MKHNLVVSTTWRLVATAMALSNGQDDVWESLSDLLLHSPSLGIAYLTSTLCSLMAQEIVRGRLTWFVALSGCLSVSTGYQPYRQR